MADRKVNIIIEINSKELAKDLKSAERSVSQFTTTSTKGFNTASASFASFLGNFGAGTLLSIIGNATSAMKNFATASIKASSDATEDLNKFNVVFSSIKKDADDISDNLVKNFGLAGSEARKLLANTGDLLTGFGFTQKSALDLSKQVQELAVDLASFTNVEGGAETASSKLTKALLGEREGLKELGISISELDVKRQVSINNQNGLTFATERQAKAQATLDLAMKQSKNAIGDYARSSSSFANQSKLLDSRLLTLQETFGNFVTQNPEVLKAFSNVNNIILKITDSLVKGQGPIAEFVTGIAKFVGNLTPFDATTASVAELNEELKNLQIDRDFGIGNLPEIEKKISQIKALLNENYGTGNLVLAPTDNSIVDFYTKIGNFTKDNPIDVNVTPKISSVSSTGEEPSVKTDKEIELEAKRAEIKLEQQNEFYALSAEQRKEFEEQEKEALFELEAQKLEILYQAQIEKANLMVDANEKEVAIENAKLDKMRKLSELEVKNYQKNKKSRVEAEVAVSNQQINIAQNTANLIDAINGKQTKAGFLLRQSAAVANIFLADAQARANAMVLAALNPVQASALQGLITANTAVSLATVAAQTIQGFSTGGVINQGSTTGDNALIRVNRKERVLTAEQNMAFEQLAYNKTDGSGLTSELLLSINQTLMDKEFVVNIDGERLNKNLQEESNRRLK